jgi:DNA-binding CsgD family transcriptional regulator
MRVSFRCLFLLVVCQCCCTGLFAQSLHFDAVLSKPYAEGSVVYDTLVLPALLRLPRPELYRQLDALGRQARQAGDYGMQLEAAFSRLNYQQDDGRISTDEKIAALKKLLQETDPDRYPEYVARIWTDLGNNYYGKKHDYVAAFDCYNSAYNLARTFSSAAFPQKKAVFVNVGNRYYTLGDADRARAILQEADSLPQIKGPYTSYNNKNTLGLIYRNAKSYDTAIRYFRLAHDLARQAGDTIWMAIAEGNIGIAYYHQGRYAEAVPLLRKDAAAGLASLRSAADNGMNSLLILADIHLKTDSMSELKEDIRLAWQYLDSCRDRIKPLSMLYPVLAGYYYNNGDLQAAFAAQKSAVLYTDSLRRRDDIYQVARVQHLREVARHQAEVEQLTSEKKLAVFTRNALLAGLAMLGLIAALVVNRQRLRNAMRQQSLRAAQALAEQAMRNATGQLAEYTRHLQEKNALIERTGQELENLRAQLAGARREEADAGIMQQLYNSTILTDDEWNHFRQLFEQVHKGYLLRLREKYPDLTPGDTRFIVLSKLKLSNKEMAGVLGVSPDTVRGYKHRLRKRFGLPEDDSISEWIDAV